MRMGAQSHLSVVISANGYTVSNYKYYILERVDTLAFSGKNGEFVHYLRILKASQTLSYSGSTLNIDFLKKACNRKQSCSIV